MKRRLKIWWLELRYEALSNDIITASERVRQCKARAEEALADGGKIAERVRAMQVERSAIGGTIASLKSPQQILREVAR